MKLTRPSEVRRLLSEIGLRPVRTLGQHFLIDHNILDILISVCGLSKRDRVLEVGPGLGVLTEPLLEGAATVVAVEKDARLAAHLRGRFEGEPRLQLICADILERGVDGLLADGITKVVSNLPYAAGTRILIEILVSEHAPQRLVVTLQEEVAARLAAEPGRKSCGLLGVWGHLEYDVNVVRTVSAACFWPSPAVRSAIVRLDRRARLPASPAERRAFFRLTKFAFGQRRKQIGGLLARDPAQIGAAAGAVPARLAAAGVDPRARPGDLCLDDWCRLARMAAGSGTADSGQSR